MYSFKDHLHVAFVILGLLLVLEWLFSLFGSLFYFFFFVFPDLPSISSGSSRGMASSPDLLRRGLFWSTWSWGSALFKRSNVCVVAVFVQSFKSGCTCSTPCLHNVSLLAQKSNHKFVNQVPSLLGLSPLNSSIFSSFLAVSCRTISCIIIFLAFVVNAHQKCISMLI